MMSFAEIGKVEGLSPEGARYVYFSAIRKLRKAEQLKNFVRGELWHPGERSVSRLREARKAAAFGKCKHCERPARSRAMGICDSHYRHLRKHGEIRPVRRWTPR